MKKLINDPSTVVRDMLEGTVALNPAAILLDDENVVIQSGLQDADSRSVAVLSGGGSGHEPAHAGYVGTGLLTAAVAGDVFTSPSTDAVLAGIRASAGPAGALLIVKNYTGDRLNFGLAAELARAEGIPVEIVVVADDVALKDTVSRDRRRGVAGTVLIHKLAGAAAERGLSLDEVAQIARDAANKLSSMGISLGSCTLPEVGKPGFVLGDHEIEVGLGIHGEQGVRRMPIAFADELVKLVLDTITSEGKLKRGDRVVLLVNGLGSTPPMELSIVTRSALRLLEFEGIVVERAWSGTFLSALDMPGFSLSVMRIDNDALDLIDAPTDAIAWPRGGTVNKARNLASSHKVEAVGHNKGVTAAGTSLRRIVDAVANALIASEPHLTDLDSVTGDGDLGTSMKRGSEAVLSLPVDNFGVVSDGLMSMANAVRRAIGGSSGPFYATGLMRASRVLTDLEEPSPQQLADAFIAAVDAVQQLGGAKVGDRTMVDALYPAAATFRAKLQEGLSKKDAWKAAVEAGIAGAEATKAMMPRLGRASYLGERAVGHPDGGAVAVTVWLKAVNNQIA
ncbi:MULTISPECIES: dihydroxyacetone kinase subunit DhaL [Agrobacterium]|uniref:dihydroxyacetone kinase subunit DhaL n=1 Tax=Agrobacterium TaxID=357 RepID=UPI00080FA61F|nr:dihydroxyacetone kinase subunit DhaL [Agrobacterium sp. 13-2099-1-2]NSY46515.1 dihydroxyacetone kinase subunit DhaK [Agrobacterium tumefaciens]UZX45245.1 dihydroxyacetone kinase subunit DhaL [Agrobacterium sp. 13-2099-1-2]